MKLVNKRSEFGLRQCVRCPERIYIGKRLEAVDAIREDGRASAVLHKYYAEQAISKYLTSV